MCKLRKENKKKMTELQAQEFEKMIKDLKFKLREYFCINTWEGSNPCNICNECKKIDKLLKEVQGGKGK